jgi:hypothetical protein
MPVITLISCKLPEQRDRYASPCLVWFVKSGTRAAVFAADIYHNTFAGETRDQEAWERYRRGILEHGGCRDEMEMLKEFLGRSPSSEFLLRSL